MEVPSAIAGHTAQPGCTAVVYDLTRRRDTTDA
jgi:hypothetical protein